MLRGGSCQRRDHLRSLELGCSASFVPEEARGDDLVFEIETGPSRRISNDPARHECCFRGDQRVDRTPRVRAWFDAQSARTLFHLHAGPRRAALWRSNVSPAGRAEQTEFEECDLRAGGAGLRDRILVVSIAAAAAEFGRLVAERERVGRPIETMDALIAAIARAHRATLATRDVDDFEDWTSRSSTHFAFGKLSPANAPPPHLHGHARVRGADVPRDRRARPRRRGRVYARAETGRARHGAAGHAGRARGAPLRHAGADAEDAAHR